MSEVDRIDVLAHCQEQARRAVRARGWTSAVADDAANAATAVFYNEIQALREQQRGAVSEQRIDRAVREAEEVLIGAYGEPSHEEEYVELIGAMFGELLDELRADRQAGAVSPERINAAIDAAVLACEQADGGRSGRSAALRRELETKLRSDQQRGTVGEKP